LQAIGKLILIGGFLEARGNTALSLEARPIVGIEEPEAHLHPQSLAVAWSVISGFPAQKIVTTNSGELLAAVPLRAVRRLMRRRGSIAVFRPGNKLSTDELRRIGYHIRARRGAVMFARCWLLIEGETEFWLLPELARLMGYEFPTEGIRCVEFAQSGIEPLLKLANDMGIEWHLLADGDKAGRYYAEQAGNQLRRRKPEDRITVLDDLNIEHCLWRHGYANVYASLAGIKSIPTSTRRRRDRPAAIIERAMHRRSKPAVALAVAEAAGRKKSPGVPPLLQDAIETVVRLARNCGR
jgi:putative ATP-dependent endonuclease of OLD family